MNKFEFKGSRLFGSWEWDTTGTDVYCSEGIFAMFNQPITPNQIINKQTFLNLIAPGNTTFLHDIIAKASPLKETVFSFELKNQAPLKI